MLVTKLPVPVTIVAGFVTDRRGLVTIVAALVTNIATLVANDKGLVTNVQGFLTTGGAVARLAFSQSPFPFLQVKKRKIIRNLQIRSKNH